MNSYLKQLARHYCSGSEDVSRILFVFPSRRAIAFFLKSLGEVVVEDKLKPFVAPQTVSIDDFFRSLSSRQIIDRISLIVRLYDSYAELRKDSGECESLDDFLFWGDVILNDFGDVDKYMVDARDLFRNVSQLKDMQDDYSDLEPIQIEAIKSFVHHFETKGAVKEKFARIWNILGELYTRFNDSLAKEGLAYDGAMLRELAGQIKSESAVELLGKAYPSCDKVVFCGLNVLCTAEKMILRSFQKAGLAEFSWDYSSRLIKDESNRSSLFMRDNVAEFGQCFELEPCNDIPEIQVVAVPSSVGQTKVVSSMLSDGSADTDVRTALVLPDETLLLPMLNSLPPDVSKVNVTMGYPMSSSSFFAFVSDLLMLQQNIRIKDSQPCFYHKYVRNIIDSSIINAVADEKSKSIFAEVKKAGQYFVPSDKLAGSRLTELIFKPAETIEQIVKYLLDILNCIGGLIAGDEKLRISCVQELDFAMESIKQINLLAKCRLDVQPKTFMRLVERSLASISVPFKGEPLEGLQIMGPLETRALDFETVFILSSNEGVFPRNSLSPSFVTHSLRTAFGMPTYVFQDAVWAYYFYRLAQRAKKLVLLYDSRSEGLKSGEESRYIKQLRYAFGQIDIKFLNAVSSPSLIRELGEIAKTDEDLRIIRSKELSASALKSYLNCPAKFYYSFVKGLRSEDEVSESLDGGMMGNVFHKTMQNLYATCAKDRIITGTALEKLLGDEIRIRTEVEKQVVDQMKGADITGRNIILTSVLVDYVKNTLKRDIELIKESGREYMDYYGSEIKCLGEFDGFRVKGYIDRLDSLKTGTVRVVDYKTGKVLDTDKGIVDENAEVISDMIYDPQTPFKKRPLVAFQFFFYDLLLELAEDSRVRQLVKAKDIRNSVYVIKEMYAGAPGYDDKSEKFHKQMKEKLSALLKEMVDKEIPFTRSGDDDCCKYCDFKTLCAR